MRRVAVAVALQLTACSRLPAKPQSQACPAPLASSFTTAEAAEEWAMIVRVRGEEVWSRELDFVSSSGTKRLEILPKGGSITGVDFAHGKLAVTTHMGGADSTIYIRSGKDLESVEARVIPDSRPHCPALLSNGDVLFEKQERWFRATAAAIDEVVLDGGVEDSYCVQVADDDSLAWTDRAGRARWARRLGEPSQIIPGGAATFSAEVMLARSGRFVLVRNDQGRIIAVDTTSMAPMKLGAKVHRGLLSPDGAWFLDSFAGTPSVVNLGTGCTVPFPKADEEPDVWARVKPAGT